MRPLFPKSRMMDRVREKGGEITGRVARAVTSFLPRRLVRATKKAKRKPRSVERVAVSRAQLHRAGQGAQVLLVGEDLLPDREGEAPLVHEGEAQGLEEGIGHEGEHDGEEHQDGVAREGIPGEGGDAEAQREDQEGDRGQGVGQVVEGREHRLVHGGHDEAQRGVALRVGHGREHEQGLPLPQAHRLGHHEDLEVRGRLDAGLEGGLALPLGPERLQLGSAEATWISSAPGMPRTWRSRRPG